MDSDAPLDFALFQLSPKRSRCELFVSGKGRTEKIASGFLKPFITHLKVAEEQSTQPSIRLQVEKRGNVTTWFTKGTLERFVRFVTTPEILELANTFDAEMSQLEGARKIYSQGAGGSASSGENERTSAAAADITKRELLKAIDVRLMAVNQDLTTACTRATSAGFTLHSVSHLLLFSDHFRAHRLSEACMKFVSLCQRRPDLVTTKGFDDSALRCSSSSDMSLDEPEPVKQQPQPVKQQSQPVNQQSQPVKHQTEPAKQQTEPVKQETEPVEQTEPVEPQQSGRKLTRRLSVQDRISMFEKQASSSTTALPTAASVPAVVKAEHRRVPSNTSLDKTVLRRWSGASDMSIDNPGTSSDNTERKETGTIVGTSTSETRSGFGTGVKQEDDVSSKPPQKENPNPNLNRYESHSGFDAGTKQVEEENPNSYRYENRAGFGTGTGTKNEEDVSSKPLLKENPNPISSDNKVEMMNLDEESNEIQSFVTKKENPVKTGTQFKNFKKGNVGPSVVQVQTIQDEPVVVKDIGVASVSLEPSVQKNQEILTKSKDSFFTKSKVTSSTNQGKIVPRKMKPDSSDVPAQQFSVNKPKQESSYEVVSSEANEIMNKSEARITRQAKGNNNDELQLKAVELEKLFAAHKLRVKNDTSTPSTRRNPKPKDVQFKESSMNGTDFNASSFLSPPESGPHSLPEEFRGKFYEKYTLKREAKLKEEWRSNRDEKEASLRAMQDSLEKSRAELRVKFAQSDPGRARIRNVRKTSFGSRSELRDQGAKFLLEDEDEDRSYSDNLSADGSSKSADSRKNGLVKKPSSSTNPNNRAIPIPPKPYSRTIPSTNPNSKNPLAQSVPNFGDFRKENTKPFMGPMRGNNNAATRAAQVMKSYARSKSKIEEGANNNSALKEDISRRTQSMRKSMLVATAHLTSEPKDTSTFDDTNNTNFGFSFASEIVPRPVLFHDPIDDEDFDTTSLDEENPNPNPSIPESPADSDTENPNSDDLTPVVIPQNPNPPFLNPNLPQYEASMYQNETSDTDAFAESPTGSPASWSSSRRKWGAAQNPSIVVGKKEATKGGFKRLLNFGRKSNGREDCGSVTTSEGDEDFTEDFRRSNLGFSLGDSYGETEAEQGQSLRSSIPNAPISFKLREDHLSGSSIKAPRSFFSLSTFRSKGSESKLR